MNKSMEGFVSTDKISSKKPKRLNSDTELGHSLIKKISINKKNNFLTPLEKSSISKRSSSNKSINKFNINSTFHKKQKDTHLLKKMNSCNYIDRNKFRNIQENQIKNDPKNFDNFGNISQINIENDNQLSNSKSRHKPNYLMKSCFSKDKCLTPKFKPEKRINNNSTNPILQFYGNAVNEINNNVNANKDLINSQKNQRKIYKFSDFKNTQNHCVSDENNFQIKQTFNNFGEGNNDIIFDNQQNQNIFDDSKFSDDYVEFVGSSSFDDENELSSNLSSSRIHEKDEKENEKKNQKVDILSNLVNLSIKNNENLNYDRRDSNILNSSINNSSINDENFFTKFFKSPRNSMYYSNKSLKFGLVNKSFSDNNETNNSILNGEIRKNLNNNSYILNNLSIIGSNKQNNILSSKKNNFSLFNKEYDDYDYNEDEDENNNNYIDNNKLNNLDFSNNNLNVENINKINNNETKMNNINTNQNSFDQVFNKNMFNNLNNTNNGIMNNMIMDNKNGGQYQINENQMKMDQMYRNMNNNLSRSLNGNMNNINNNLPENGINDQIKRSYTHNLTQSSVINIQNMNNYNNINNNNFVFQQMPMLKTNVSRSCNTINNINPNYLQMNQNVPNSNSKIPNSMLRYQNQNLNNEYIQNYEIQNGNIAANYYLNNNNNQNINFQLNQLMADNQNLLLNYNNNQNLINHNLNNNYFNNNNNNNLIFNNNYLLQQNHQNINNNLLNLNNNPNQFNNNNYMNQRNLNAMNIPSNEQLQLQNNFINQKNNQILLKQLNQQLGYENLSNIQQHLFNTNIQNNLNNNFNNNLNNNINNILNNQKNLPNNNNNYSPRKSKKQNFTDLSNEDLSKQAINIAKHQSGCRYLQKRIETYPDLVPTLFFPNALGHIKELSNDQFGNYYMEILIKYLPENMLLKLMELIFPEVLDIGTNQYGTKVLQYLMNFLNNEKLLLSFIDIILPHVVSLVTDLNGTHIIQKIISVNSPHVQIIFDIIFKNIKEIAITRVGSNFIKKVLDSLKNEISKENLDSLIIAINLNLDTIIVNQHGNYIIQNLVTLDNDINYKIIIIETIIKNIVAYSNEKYSSNVVEKCFDVPEMKNKLIEELIKKNNFEKILLNEYGNYVIQKALMKSDENIQIIMFKLLNPIVRQLQCLPFGQKLLNKLFNLYPKLSRCILNLSD